MASIEEVISWVEAQASKADMGNASARVRVTSIRQMAEQVAPGEPADARSVLNDMDRLRERWARRNLDGKSGTAKTYASRARSTIEEYFRWAAAPDKYGPKKSVPKSAESKKAPEKKVTKVEPVAPPIVQVQHPPPPAAPVGDVRTCNLGQGREPFRYILPGDGLQVKDAIRIAFHLITTCDDYDPTCSPMQVVSSAMQRSQ